MSPKNIAILALILFMGFAGCSGIEIVHTGHRGVKTVYSKVQPGILEEGLYWVNPLTSAIHQMNVQTERYNVEIPAYTRDIQTVNLNVAVNYNLEKTKAPEMYRDVGQDWADKLLPQTVAGVTKTAIGKWDAVDLIANRDKAQQDIQDQLIAVMATRDIHVTRVEIVGAAFNKDFEEAVEKKVRAIQEADQAKNKTVQIAEQAKQTVITAEADAKSMQIRAEALSQNKSLVGWEAVQALKEAVVKWNGIAPVIVGGSGQILNIPAALLGGSDAK